MFGPRGDYGHIRRTVQVANLSIGTGWEVVVRALAR
jgi:hypothetical protein